MRSIIETVVQNPLVRALVLVGLIVPISSYLGTSPVRRGILYYMGIFAPAIVASIAVGLWTWNWKVFGTVLALSIAITILTQAVVYWFS